MPAVSRAQRRFFGYLVSSPAEAARRGISMKAVQEYAETPDRGLPERKKSNRPNGANSHMRRGYRSN